MLTPGVPPGPEAFRYSCSNNTYTERTDIVIIRIRNVTGDLIAFLSVTEVAHIYIYIYTLAEISAHTARLVASR